MNWDQESITLKWGTLKGWNHLSPSTKAILQKYVNLSMSSSAMQQRDTPEQKRLLCDAIRNIKGPIYNDWEGGEMSKEDAIKYVMEYER